MRDFGFDEVVGWSFADPGQPGRLRIPADDERASGVVLANPLSEDQSAMRTTVLGSLLDVAQRNLARGTDAVALFESGRVYLPAVSGAKLQKSTPDVQNVDLDVLAGSFSGERPAPDREPHRIGCLAVGPLTARSWRGDGESADFFALKGVLEALAGQLGTTIACESGEQPFLHPGRSAAVNVGGIAAGWIGELHPLVCRAWDIEAAVGFEVDLAALVAAATAGEETYEDVTTFPAVYQDLAVVVPIDQPAAELRQAVLTSGGELLHAADVFDLYAGEQVGEGRKSLALRLEFRAPDRTLTDREVGEQRAAIEAALKKMGGSLRA
jgi:phenylalanyl-tRNA synthetase beta chain